MKELLVAISEPVIVGIDMIAWLIIVIGTLQALVRVVGLFIPGVTHLRRREVWLGYARWLVAALTFQLAADIIESSISTDWESIARLGAIALIRTFLDYFLERDVGDVRESLEARRAPLPEGNRPP
jgi:uncharacterized membrane protein